MIDWITKLVLFLAPYPLWVKLIVAAWFLFTASIGLVLIFARPGAAPSAPAEKVVGTPGVLGAERSPLPQSGTPVGPAISWPPVRVVLADRSVVDVELSMQYQVRPENAPRVLVEIGNIEKVAQFLRPIVESRVIATLSRLTYPELAASLAGVAEDITREVRARAVSSGVTVHAVYITKLSLVSANPTRE